MARRARREYGARVCLARWNDDAGSGADRFTAGMEAKCPAFGTGSLYHKSPPDRRASLRGNAVHSLGVRPVAPLVFLSAAARTLVVSSHLVGSR